MESALERSRWVYLHEPDRFRHAEDIRYADQYRHGRNWSGYQLPPSLPLHTDPVSLNTFKEKMKSLPDQSRPPSGLCARHQSSIEPDPQLADDPTIG
jgi:hypothetical protein